MKKYSYVVSVSSKYALPQDFNEFKYTKQFPTQTQAFRYARLISKELKKELSHISDNSVAVDVTQYEHGEYKKIIHTTNIIGGW